MSNSNQTEKLPRALWISAFGVMALILVITALSRRIDYDEFLHVHSLWLVAQGQVPFSDFLAVHPPLFWYVYAPLFKLLPQKFETIIVLRLINLTFALLLLVFLARLLTRRLPGNKGALAVGLAMLAMFFQPSVIETLTEFRMDHLSTALLLGGLVLYDDMANIRRAFFAGVIIALGLTMNLKLLLIPVFVIGIDAAPLLFRRYVPWHKLGAAIAGTVCGAAAVIGFLVLKHVNINDAYQFVYAYHAAIASEFKRSPGLLAMLVDINRAQYFLPTVFAVIGFFMLVTDWKAETIQKNKFALVFLLFSVAQTILVPFPFKQYMCSVFLMWIAPLAVTYDRWFSG
jgi:hypothetical protein